MTDSGVAFFSDIDILVCVGLGYLLSCLVCVSSLQGCKENTPPKNRHSINHISSVCFQEAYRMTGSGVVFYSDIPRPARNKAMTPQEITQMNMDKSSVLEDVIINQCGGGMGIIVASYVLSVLASLLMTMVVLMVG